MSTLRKGISLGLMVCLFHLCLVNVAWSVEKGASDAAAVKQQVQLFGVRAQVKLRLADGTKLQGTVQSIEDTAFELITPSGNLTNIAYDQVTTLRLAAKSLSYQAKSQPDPAEARRTALSLAGKHVNVRVTGGDKVHGVLQAVEQEHFTLVTASGTPRSIAYEEVTQLESHSGRASLYILLGVAGGIALGIGIFAAEMNH